MLDILLFQSYMQDILLLLQVIIASYILQFASKLEINRHGDFDANLTRQCFALCRLSIVCFFMLLNL